MLPSPHQPFQDQDTEIIGAPDLSGKSLVSDQSSTVTERLSLALITTPLRILRC